MRFEIQAFITFATWILASTLFASEPATKHQPDNLLHKWDYITFPWDLPAERERPSFSVGWRHQEEGSRGLRVDIHNLSEPYEFLKTNGISARLYRANGEISEPTKEGKMLLKAPVYIGEDHGTGEPRRYQLVTYFPWGSNTLGESWIEIVVRSERYWLEIPYGFDRDPATPLPTPVAGGAPRFPSEMNSLTERDHIVRWKNVHYALGRTKSGAVLSLIQSNPVDAESDIDVYRSAQPQDIYSQHTSLRLFYPDGNATAGRCANIHLDDNWLRRTDSFRLVSRNKNELRSWGHIEISVDDEIFKAILPSSLYSYVHGHARQPASLDFLSALHAGMTLREVDRLSRGYVTKGIRDLVPSPPERQQYHYVALGGVLARGRKINLMCFRLQFENETAFIAR